MSRKKHRAYKPSPERAHSVQTFLPADIAPGAASVASLGSSWLTLSSTIDECPAYWSRWRDAWLREFVYRPGNDLLAGAISTVAAKVATTGWYFEGPERTANFYRRVLLEQMGFGAGWTFDIMQGVWDYLTQDAGWSEERIRLGDADRAGAAIGFAHLDAARVYPTLDPEWPIRYNDVEGDPTDANTFPLLHNSQVVRIVDSPTPNRLRRGVGFCAVSRALTTAHILMDIATYERERLSDLPPAGLLLINNLTRDQWLDLTKGYDVKQKQQGNRVWRDVMVAFGLDPALPLKAELMSFRQVPEHFDKRETTEIAVYSFALAFRVDPRDLWPVSSGTLGTATEAEVMHLKAKAKGPGLILTSIERALNDGFSLPPSLTFTFDFQDTDEDEQAARIAESKAKFIGALATPPMGQAEGIITREEARAWLVRQSLFDEDELPALVAPTEQVAEDIEAAKSLARLDMGPRSRVYSDGRVIRLERRPVAWSGHQFRAGPVALAGYQGAPVDGKLRPAGQPLPVWPAGEPVAITADDVAAAMRRWDAQMPAEYKGMLMPEVRE